MKSKLRLLRIFLIIISIGISGCAGLGGKVNTLQMLRKLGQNDKLKQRVLKQETANFQRVKNYIDSNKIKRGISTKFAIKKFGEPVLVFSDPEGEKWIYKRSDVDWIGGEKIYLFFDKQGSLVSASLYPGSQKTLGDLSF